MRIRELEKESLREGLWNDPEKAGDILREKSRLTDVVEKWKRQRTHLEDLRILAEIALEEQDDRSRDEIAEELERLKTAVRDDELRMMLASEQDPMNAIMSIHAGAGGKEAQDWAEMLLRMYLRWAEKKSFNVQMVDLLAGEEAGIKSATFTVSGPYAYGFIKAESGIHRLVRISPFDASGRRHTSFAAVFVYPDVEDRIEVDVKQSDLRIDTYRASGAGGQHVNKTSSAVRITHLPTGIVVACQNEKSQHRNRDIAMKVLRARLYEREKRVQQDKLQEIHDNLEDIAWGNQIRSYVMQPYRLVKDHRTGVEKGDVDSVMNGGLDEFIEAYLYSLLNSKDKSATV